MAKKGETKSLKRLKAPKTRKLKRKEGTWTIRSRAGAYKGSESVPLGFVLRDLIGVCSTLREVKIILTEGKVEVNGVKRNDYRFSIGLFDIISIGGLEKDYRIAFDLKGRFEAEKTEKKEKKTKISKITGKRKAKGGKFQLRTNDGRTITMGKAEAKVGDSIEIELPGQKVAKTLAFAKGAKAYIIGGKHAGKKAEIVEVREGEINKPRLVLLKEDKKEFLTTADKVFVVG